MRPLRSSPRVLRSALASVAVAAVLAACAPASSSPTAAPGGGSDIGSVVALDILTTLALLHLGVVPSGAPNIDDELAVTFGAELAPTADIGREGELDVERLLALAPDLVIGVDFGDGDADAVRSSGLTFVEMPFAPYGWREHHLAVGDAVGAGELAREQVEEAEARLAELDAAVPDGTVLGVVSRTGDGGLWFLTGWFPADVLDAAGFLLPAGNRFEPDAVDPTTFEGGTVTLSAERVGELADADVLLVARGAGGSAAGSALEELESDPLAATLPAVERGATAEVGFDVWGYQSVGNVLRIAEDIETLVLPHLGS
jgi:iron complex transport system substrate-binding protein